MSTPTMRHPRPEGWWAYPPAYACGVYLAGFVTGLPWWVYLVVGVAVAVIGRVAARALFHRVDYGQRLADWAAGCWLVTGPATAAWLIAARGPGGPVAVWQWLAAGLAVLGGWWWLVVWLAPAAAARVDARYPADVPAESPAAAPPALVAAYSAALARAGCDDVDVLGVTVSPSGGVESVRITAADGKDVTRAAFIGRMGKVVNALAKYLARARQVDLDDDDVNVEKGRNASEWVMHVTVARVLERSNLYVPDTSPQPWVGAKHHGQYEDDQPLDLTICDARTGAVHGEVVMATGAGKTNIINVITGRQTASDQGEVWFIGSNKLVKMAWPWLKPWIEGRTDRPVIDRVAGENPVACLRALADAYQYAVLCNRLTPGNSARVPTRGRGGLLVFIEEASDLLMRNELTVICHDGKARNASQIVSLIQKIGRTAPAQVIKVNQDALFESLGDEGNRQRRNSLLGIAGQVMRAQDATSAIPALPGVNAAKLTHHALYVQPGGDEPRAMRAKFDYMPDGENDQVDLVDQVAVINTAWRYGLDPAITRQLRYYDDRWNARWHGEFIEFLEHLNATDLHPRSDLSWPTSRPAPDTEGATPDPEPAPAPAAATTKEPTVTDDVTPAPDLPAGFHDDSFDIWAALDAADGVTATTSQAPPATGGHFHSDPSLITGPVDKLARWLRAQEPPAPAAVPDPLGIVLALLAKPQAPEWVPTEVLAIATGRVAADADDDARKKAAEQLGLELSRQAGVSSQTLSKSVDKRRRRGYSAAELRAAGERLAAGG